MTMPKAFRAILLAASLACPATAALASVAADVLQRTRDPDWPCVQAKVPELSPTAVWSGPPIDEALKAWEKDTKIAGLVAELAARRMPVEEATAAIGNFAKGLAAAEKAEKLTRLFAGLFETLDRERADVMQGIGRYARQQKAMAEAIRQAMSKAQDPSVAPADPQQASALNEQLVWQTRIFNERRAALTYVCEVPTIIEQRLFALARAIAAEMAR
jgi:hypothetical protein